MDPVWLARNIASSWRFSDGLAEFATRLRFTYAKGDGAEAPREWEIGYKYPAPVGRIRLALRSNGGSDKFIHGEVFEHLYYELGLASAPDTILDLGANIGLTAVYFARRFPTAGLAVVEPIPSNLRVLRRNLELNGIEARIFEAAVGISDGEVTMLLDANDYGHKVVDGAAEGSHLVCPSISVPSMMKALGWDRIGLLKMDIEGYENVLFSQPTEWMRQVDALCIECHDGFGQADLERIALDYGFAPPRLLPGIWLLTRPGATVAV